MACDCCGVTQRKLWVFGCGSFFVLLAVILGVLWPTLSLQLLHSQLVLEEGSVNYENWIETPIPMYLEVTLFNWTNSDKIDDRFEKPNFVEVGPFVFREKHKRRVSSWNSENDTVTFSQQRIWHYDEELSNNLSLDTPVTAANVITATVVNMMKSGSPAIKKFINYILNSKSGSLTWTKPAREWIFDGISDPLLDFLHTLNLTGINIPFQKFGWLGERNNSWTYDGIFTMKTGKDDIKNLGKQTLWNGADQTKFYSNYCGMVNGTTGELWPPDIDTKKGVTIFATDICRSVTLQPLSKPVDVFGIEGTVWSADDKVFDNGKNYPEMECFCPAKKTKIDILLSNKVKIENNGNTADSPEPCPAYGVLDVSECKFGAPVYASFPHFYMADPGYLDKITGLKPDKNKHKFTLTMNSMTGIPLDVNARLQINMLMQPGPGFDVYKNVHRELIMPMFWFTQKAAIDEKLSDKAKLAIALPDIGIYTSYGLGAVGVAILIIGTILCITKTWKRSSQDSENLISSNSSN